MSKANLKDVVKVFTKVGIIGFGGGSAIVPVIEKSLVDDGGYVSREKYLNYNILSNITPGALPVKLAFLCGYDMAGIFGMILASIAFSLPGTIFLVSALYIMNMVGETFIKNIEYASIGISTFIIFLLCNYIKKVMTDSIKNDTYKPSILIMLVSGFLSFGKEIRSIIITLFNLPQNTSFSVSIFDISIVNLLLYTFFLIFYLGGNPNRIRYVVSTILGIIFFLIHGESKIINIEHTTILNSVIMMFGIITFIFDVKKLGLPKNTNKIDLTPLKGCIVLIIITLTLSIISYVLVSSEIDTLQLLSNAGISTVTCFGGGGAYFGMADDLFVETGMITTTELYGQIIPVANASSGPILVKMATTIGYVVGSRISLIDGLILAVNCFFITLTSTGTVCIAVNIIYTKNSELFIFEKLRRGILPVICGLLIATILSLTSEMLKVLTSVGVLPVISLFVLALNFIFVLFLNKRFGLSDIAQIIINGGLSMLLLNLI